MKVRFQADADLNQIILKATLRHEPGIDFQTAHAANLPGLDDIEVLAIAARAGQVLVTHDRKTKPKHFAEFITTETNSGVLIVSRKLSIAQVVEDLTLVWIASDADEWVNRIWSLPL